MRRCDCSSTGLSRHHSLHFVLLVKLDRAIHARRLHTLAISSNTDASCVHSQSFMVCKYCVLRSHTLLSVCLTLVEKAGLVLALRSFRCSNPSIYLYTPDVAAPMRQRVRVRHPRRYVTSSVSGVTHRLVNRYLRQLPARGVPKSKARPRPALLAASSRARLKVSFAPWSTAVGYMAINRY